MIATTFVAPVDPVARLSHEDLSEINRLFRQDAHQCGVDHRDLRSVDAHNLMRMRYSDAPLPINFCLHNRVSE